jgi:hypothetical protein
MVSWLEEMVHNSCIGYICFPYKLIPVIFAFLRLMMDGTSLAAKDCYIATTADSWALSHVNQDEKLLPIHRVITRFHQQGYFKKPWILFPLNLNESHWILVALLNPCCLNAPQESKLTGYLYYDPLGLQDQAQEMTVMKEKGLLNFIVCCNMLHGEPAFAQHSNIMEVLYDKEKFVRVTIDPADVLRQPDLVNCGLCVYLCMI